MTAVRKLDSVPQRIIDYLNEKAKKKRGFKLTAPALRMINARLAEGYEYEDFCHVIDVKVFQWMGNNMEKYIRPSMLFRPCHFDEYLNEEIKAEKRFPAVWTKAHEDKLSPQEKQAWWKEMRDAGLNPVKNTKGTTTEWK